MALLDTLTSQFLSAHPGEAARTIETLPAEQRHEALLAGGSAAAATTLQAMDPSLAVSALQRSGDAAPAILAQMQFDAALLLLHRMDPHERDTLLEQLPASVARTFKRRLLYPEGTAGSVMDPRTTEIAVDITVGDALAQLRSLGFNPSAVVYVIDRAQRLVGVLTLGQLFRADESALVANVMIREVRFLRATQTTADVINNPGWNRFHRLPVVDEQQRLVGMISDPFGQEELEVIANASGIIIGRTNLPLVNEGEALFHIARFESSRQAENTVEAFQADDIPIHPSLDEEPPIV